MFAQKPRPHTPGRFWFCPSARLPGAAGLRGAPGVRRVQQAEPQGGPEVPNQNLPVRQQHRKHTVSPAAGSDPGQSLTVTCNVTDLKC